MIKRPYRFLIPGLLVFFIFFQTNLKPAFSQAPKKDSALSLSMGYEQLSSKTKVVVARELVNSRIEFKAHQAVIQQGRTFVLIKNEIVRTRNFLKQGYSYHEIKHEIDKLNEWKKLAGEGVINSKNSRPTVRNLTTTSILLKELLKRTENRLQHISAYHRSLGQCQYMLDSLMMDSILYVVPNDSVALIRYFQRLMLLGKDYKPVIVPLKIALDSIEKLAIQVNLIKFSLESDIAETESKRQDLMAKIGIFEAGSLHSADSNDVPLFEAVRFSAGKAGLVLFFYVGNHLSALILMVLFIIGFAFYLALLKRKSKDDHLREDLKQRQEVLSHPIAASTLLVITVFQFFLPVPPFVLSGCLWTISGIALSVIMRNAITPYWYKAWMALFLLFLLGSADNLMLRQSAPERWTVLLLSIAGLVCGVVLLTGKKRHEIREQLILVFIAIMIVFEILAVINFFSGGYNQIKTFMSSGFFTIIVAYLLYWTFRLGNDTLLISFHFHKAGEDEHHQQQAENSAKKVPLYLYLLFFAGCFILITRNFYFYQSMFEPLSEALTATRTLGAFAFTYSSIFIFIFVLVLSVVISRVVSFLASDQTVTAAGQKPGGLGSWLLLIRIAIITLGIMLAFVSAGIPMDKFAIILGALSVGIGFGLQTLVNNLVSGVFIAFEKPVNVGDIVDISGQTGKVKSIGIRSSIITTWEGADVIVPNGDLLNLHLVNWTMGNSRRRYEIMVGVAYGTDLDTTKGLLVDLMMKDQRILKNPPPFVLATEFSNSSIDLVLKFWVPHFSIGVDVKSDLILAIDVLFKEHGIQIPFPQTDVHIKTALDSPVTEKD
jgi:small-conductance mechanosensitive channel